MSKCKACDGTGKEPKADPLKELDGKVTALAECVDLCRRIMGVQEERIGLLEGRLWHLVGRMDNFHRLLGAQDCRRHCKRWKPKP